MKTLILCTMMVPCVLMVMYIIPSMIFGPLSLIRGQEYVEVPHAQVNTILLTIAGYGGFSGLLVTCMLLVKKPEKLLRRHEIALLWFGRIGVVAAAAAAFYPYLIAHILNSVAVIGSFIVEYEYRKRAKNMMESKQ